MLFNSINFIFVFLPITFVMFFVLGKYSKFYAAAWLTIASLVYYGWWNYQYVLLLLLSIFMNYAAGYLINLKIVKGEARLARWYLIGAISLNLAALFYYKYVGFFGEILREVSGVSSGIGAIVLPLGISFFTFTQIAFLVDTYQGKAKEYRAIHYMLFVTYFPHLIAGPILHHGQMMPQFAEAKTYRLSETNIAVGLSIFILGLAKKVLLADSFAPIASPIFAAAREGQALPLVEAWFGALAYTFQLYFDFSGYSDMAVGLSLLFNIRLPINFNSPYKSASIIDFWRRWHISLSTFLRDYLYISLGGNRKGKVRQYLNLVMTMLLCGLWHGAGWTFVVWGALHASYVVLNHAFRAIRTRLGIDGFTLWGLGRPLSILTTFVMVVIGWVVFRSETFASAHVLLSGMFGEYGIKGAAGFMPVTNLKATYVAAMLIVGFAICWFLPNTQQWTRAYRPVYQDVEPPRGMLAHVKWSSKAVWTWVGLGMLLALSLLRLSPTQVSEFLYYQF